MVVARFSTPTEQKAPHLQRDEQVGDEPGPARADEDAAPAVRAQRRRARLHEGTTRGSCIGCERHAYRVLGHKRRSGSSWGAGHVYAAHESLPV